MSNFYNILARATFGGPSGHLVPPPVFDTLPDKNAPYLTKSQRIELDFETRSRQDLKLVGAWKYAEHKTTTVLCFSYVYPENPGQAFIWTPDNPIPARLIAEVMRPDRGFEAHNAGFEFAIWNLVLAPRFGFPPLAPEKFYCSSAKAAQCSLPTALERAAKALDLPIQKDMEGHRVMLKLCKPRTLTKNNKNPYHVTADDFKKMYEYCKTDALTERLLSGMLPDLPPSERQIWLLDQTMNRRGVKLDLETTEQAKIILTEQRRRLTVELRAITQGAVATATSVAAMRRFIETDYPDHALPDLTSATVDAVLKDESNTPGTYPPVVVRVLEIRQMLGKSSTAKIDRMLATCCDDGRVRDYLFYHAASTGRWGGRGIQPQNFPRGSLKYTQVLECINDVRGLTVGDFLDKWPDPFAAVSSCLRSLLMASDGCVLRVADYASIEARGIAWLAGETSMLTLFQSGADIYKQMASDIYGLPVDEITGDHRHLGKQAILGLGYQMGAPKFADTCQGYGIAVDGGLAKRVVELYRTKYRKIVRFWRDIEAAAVEAVEKGIPTRAGKIGFQVRGDFLLMGLPSGRCLYYFKPYLSSTTTPWGEARTQLGYFGVDSQTKQFVRQHTYGGKLAENATQAVARDVMAYNMLSAEAAGYKVLLTIHDEIVSECPENFETVEHYEKMVSRVPSWALGFPIVAEGWQGPRYRKG